MTDRAIVGLLRKNLVARGTANVVRIQMQEPAIFRASFIQDAIDDLEHRLLLLRLDPGDVFSPLERLAIRVLIESAGLDDDTLRAQVTSDRPTESS